MTQASILVVDDERNIASSLSNLLTLEDYDVQTAENAEVALEKARRFAFDLFLVDVNMPGMSGIALVQALRNLDIQAPVLVMSGRANIETALSAIKMGAFDFLEKPIPSERLLLTLSRALETQKLVRENRVLRKANGSDFGLLGKSREMVALRDQIELAASAQATVLISGERGTGKELVARAVHMQSKRNKGPFEKLNCAAVPSDLIESELFGHEVGAFTSANKMRKGRFERAHRGTLFLDEVGDMPVPMQAKLLRVLQEGEVERVGGSAPFKVDVRVVAASNKVLSAEVEAGRFRADLYDRLNVVPVRVPALRERPNDIAILAAEFVKICSFANDRPEKKLSDAAMRRLSQEGFPGNVRELKNLVERLVILVRGDVIEEEDVVQHLHSPTPKQGSAYQPGTPLFSMVENFERIVLEKAIRHHQGNMTRTAEDLGLERSHLYKKMKSLGMRSKNESGKKEDES